MLTEAKIDFLMPALRHRDEMIRFARAIETAVIAAVDAERAKEITCEQDAFEQWSRPDSVQRVKDDNGYTDQRMQTAFNGWLARSKLSPDIPPGFALVPIDPTEKMLDAGNSAMGGSGRWKTLYKAMIAAAQK